MSDDLAKYRSYGVWLAFGEVIIVEGPEPVWEEPGRQAQRVATVDAADYEAACRIYWESIAKKTEISEELP